MTGPPDASASLSGDGAAQRAAELDVATQRFASQLVGPGDILSARIRAAVAKEAYAALSARDVWMEFWKATPGLLDRMLAVDHKFTGGCSKTLACVVHAIVNLQPITDSEWYHSAAERIGAELIADGELHANATFEDKAMCMSEIIAVAAGGAGLAAFYKGLGKSLPSWPESASGSPFFKSLKDFYTGKIVVSSGYGHSVSDRETAKISEAALSKTGWSLKDFKANLDGNTPFCKMSLTPYSMKVQQDWMRVCYIPPMDVTSFKAQPPPSRCLSRSDLEVVAAAYAGAVTCHF
ncbi:rlmJ [Symbiodinium pilosum]|uniref:RlmJ protein n=1 Tax=Symbiodinium pilosum TaxID=2952 RepID=A0A812XJN8_SYMPI|nr:rlmJ [Symbiodinium pilosum]